MDWFGYVANQSVAKVPLEIFLEIRYCCKQPIVAIDPNTQTTKEWFPQMKRSLLKYRSKILAQRQTLRTK